MNLTAVTDEARSVGEGPREEYPFRVAVVGEHLELALADPGTLATVAQNVADVARKLSCQALAGASPLGERLAAAAVVTSDNGLRLYAGDDVPQRVLIVDGLLATGTRLAWTAQALKAAGVEKTPAAVLVTIGGLDQSPPGLDEVVSLH